MEKTSNKNNGGFVKSIFILSVGGLVAKLLGAFYRIPLTNVVGSYGMGIYQLVFPLFSLLLTISTAGIPVAVSKLVAEKTAVGDRYAAKRIFSLSLAALVRGMAGFRADSNIRGILLNRVSKMLYPRLKDMLEQELKKSGYDIPVVGYIPEDEAFRLESRHLGLVTPQELNNLKEQTERAGRILAESVDLDQILSVAQAAPELETEETRSVHPADGYGLAENRLTGDGCSVRDGKDRKEGQKQLRIGIARDEAFCFYYKANLELLEKMGCELVSFSPLRDKKLPENISGLILGGGYPELYGKRLSENRGLLDEIRRSLDAGMPCLAECGGFMYLHEQMEDRDGNVYPLAGVIKGKTCPAGKLVRFGYVNITADKETDWLLPGETIRGHEFHYWDSTDSGNDCMAVKPDGKRKWNCIHMRENMFAGYPHLYLPSMPEFARRFAVRCYEWERTRCGNCHSTGECSKK